MIMDNYSDKELERLIFMHEETLRYKMGDAYEDITPSFSYSEFLNFLDFLECKNSFQNLDDPDMRGCYFQDMRDGQADEGVEDVFGGY